MANIRGRQLKLSQVQGLPVGYCPPYITMCLPPPSHLLSNPSKTVAYWLDQSYCSQPVKYGVAHVFSMMRSKTKGVGQRDSVRIRAEKKISLSKIRKVASFSGMAVRAEKQEKIRKVIDFLRPFKAYASESLRGKCAV